VPAPSAVALLVAKRDHLAHSAEEIEWLIQSYVKGNLADYQMSAWLMAVALNGLSTDELHALTQAMLHSGKTLRLSTVDRPVVDKHSTGGVGDKVSLCLGPAVAACGVAVPMIAGRGLGHTGGTLDKLEAISGYNVRISAARFERIVAKVGCAIMGQTDEIAPADSRIYALRDVTGTVESIPLIVASILSKKLATRADALVMDVKCGRGAFMKDLAGARALARTLAEVGASAGRRVSALLTDMSQPLGNAIGNALETREAIEVLMGRGPADTRQLTLELGAEMLLSVGHAHSRKQARQAIARALDSGTGLEVLARMVRAHGGDTRMVEEPARLPSVKQPQPVLAERSGFVGAIDALELGLVAVELGAGRRRAEDSVDPRVGLMLARKVGDSVSRGEPLAWVHAASAADARRAALRMKAAIKIARVRPPSRAPILERVAGPRLG
jgi:pyrimidine-nucleoside phosphorylase